MTNLANFAEVIKKANEEKRLRLLQEKERQEKEVAPLLSELFSTIVKGKEAKQESVQKAAPMLAELQSALADPEKFLKEKQDTKTKIVELVTELENKASVIRAKVNNSESVDPTNLEKKFLKLFNRLQNDFQTLKRYVESKPTQSASGFGGGGSGEVRILRMDDVVKGAVPQNGAVMTWNASLNKFEFVVPTNGGVLVPQSDIYMTFSYVVLTDGAQSIPLSLTSRQVSSDFDLMINGLVQGKGYYVVNTVGLNISGALNAVAGDVINFKYLQ